MSLSFDKTAGKDVTPKAGDTWFTLAEQHVAPADVLEHANMGKKPGDAAATIRVPSYAGAKRTVCIDKASGLPVKTTTWDHADQLYEEIAFTNVQLNPKLSAADFDPTNKAYDF